MTDNEEIITEKIRELKINRKITLQTIKFEIKMMKREGLEAKEIFIKVYENSDDKLIKYLAENEISNLTMLNKKLEEKEKEENSLDELVRILTKIRLPNKKPTEFVDEINKELEKFKLEEKSVIKILATKIWSTNYEVITELERAESIEELKEKIKRNEVIALRKNKHKAYCKNCNKVGHTTIQCKAVKKENSQ